MRSTRIILANAPEVFWTHWLLAAAYGQLGELTAARNALRDVLAQKEDFAETAGQLMEKWFDSQLAADPDAKTLNWSGLESCLGRGSSNDLGAAGCMGLQGKLPPVDRGAGHAGR